MFIMMKLYKGIRLVTVAPVMAAVMLVTLFLVRPAVFASAASFWYALVFLTVLPLLAYPLQKYIPAYRDRGREGQRGLAMNFAVAGYVLGCIANLFLKSTRELWLIFLEYLFSGALIFLWNKCFHRKASGHACGVAGPLALLVAFGVYGAVLPGVLLLILVWLASIKTGRHTWRQLLGGTVIPIAVMAVLALV